MLALLLGQWGLVSFDLELQDTGERRPPWGPDPKVRLVILPSSHMMVVLSAAERSVPSTDEQRAAALNQMIAYTGQIVVNSDQLLTKVDVSWKEAWTNPAQTRSFKSIGANLSLLSA